MDAGPPDVAATGGGARRLIAPASPLGYAAAFSCGRVIFAPGSHV